MTEFDHEVEADTLTFARVAAVVSRLLPMIHPLATPLHIEYVDALLSIATPDADDVNVKTGLPIFTYVVIPVVGLM